MKNLLYISTALLFLFSACSTKPKAPGNKDGSATMQEYAIITKVFDGRDHSAIVDAEVVASLDQNQLGVVRSDSTGNVSISLQIQATEFNLDKIRLKATKQGYHDLMVNWIDVRNDSVFLALIKQ
jgi:hypothetical protein